MYGQSSAASTKLRVKLSEISVNTIIKRSCNVGGAHAKVGKEKLQKRVLRVVRRSYSKK